MTTQQRLVKAKLNLLDLAAYRHRGRSPTLAAHDSASTCANREARHDPQASYSQPSPRVFYRESKSLKLT